MRESDEGAVPADDAAAKESADQEVSAATRANCDSCKWMMGLGYNCLLGRAPERCNNNPARRGDDELAERLLNLTDQERDKLRYRLEIDDPSLKSRASREDTDIDDGL